MALTTDSYIYGTRLYQESGLVYSNASGVISAEPEFNLSRAVASPPLASTQVGSGNYILLTLPFPAVLSMAHIDVRDASNVRVSTGFTVEYASVEGPMINATTITDATFNTSTDFNPARLIYNTKATAVKLTFTSAASSFRVHAVHLYIDPRTPVDAAPGLWMSDHIFTGSLATARKAGQTFDHGVIGRGGSAHGEFYVHNSYSMATAVSPVIESFSPGDTTTRPGKQHVLYSLDRLTWSTRLVLPDIAAGGYSPLIYYIDTMHSDTPTGRVSVRSVCAPTSWSNGKQVLASETMVATFFKTVDLSAPPPDIWWADPMSVSPGGSVTLYGKGFASRDWAIKRIGSDWSLVASSPAIATTSQTAVAADDVSIVRGATAITSNISISSVTLTMPATANTAVLTYSIRSASADLSEQDVHHGIRVNPPLQGDIGLPPLLMESVVSSVIRPAGLSGEGGIEQREMSFSTPKAIITGTPRAMPRYFVNTASQISMLENSSSVGRLDGPPDFNTRGLHRWIPTTATMIARTDLGPTKMVWQSLDGSKDFLFDTTNGPYIDPSTEFGTAEAGVSISAPSMVIPREVSIKKTTWEWNTTPTGMKSQPNFTAIMVVLLGPDPSPSYREVVLGQPEKLSTLPARLLSTTSTSSDYGHLTSLYYDKRYVIGHSGRTHSRIRINYGFLGVRPIIVALSVGTEKIGTKRVPYSRTTYVGRYISRRVFSRGPFTPNVNLQIGSSVSGDDFRVLDFMAGPCISTTVENQLINNLDAIYGVLS